MRNRLLGILSIVVLGAAAFIFSRYQPIQSDISLDSVSTAPTIIVKTPKVLYGMVVDDYLVIEDKIKRNQVLGDILQSYNVPARMIQQVAQLSRSVFDVRKIAPDKKYTLICNTDSLKSAKVLVYEPNPIEYVVFNFGDSLNVNVVKREIITVEKTVSGIIQSNLSETIEQAGISAELTNKFVDIFGWQVDFQRLQKNDKFKLIYEEDQVEGVSVGIKKISAIYFEHYGKDLYAFPFDQGDGVDYFDEEGKSMRKALLKYPIEFTRISSRYTMNRFHPVQKRWKAHLGTDFAAPVGTPIRSVGDGYVEEAQYKSNNGNYVKIKHNGTYTTQYLHMSRIAAGIHAGVHVRQGETIGYVGSTGLATGPHLCYRFWKNGVQVDALQVDLPPSMPVKQEFKAAFDTVKMQLMDKLQQIPLPAQPAEAIASIR